MSLNKLRDDGISVAPSYGLNDTIFISGDTRTQIVYNKIVVGLVEQQPVSYSIQVSMCRFVSLLNHRIPMLHFGRIDHPLSRVNNQLSNLFYLKVKVECYVIMIYYSTAM